MQRRQPGIVSLLLCGWLLVGILAPAAGWGQSADPLQQVEKRLGDKRAAAEAHRKLMEGIKDPEQLNTAMQQHFKMTEEMLALMIERQKLMSAQAPSGGAPAGQSSGMPSGGMGMMQHGMGMMQKEMGGMGGSATPAGAPMGGAASGGGMGGGMMSMDKMKMSGMGGGSSSGGGMGMMDMEKMEMAGMMGMMGGMGGKGGSGMAMPSALPGFPGASHLYHIGATGFFLDHPQHIALSTEQQQMLNQIKEQAALDKASADRSVQEAEQALWTLTAADEPDNAQIEAKVAEIEKLRGDARLRFIRAVGGAAKILTGFAPPAPAAPMPAGGMKDM